MILPDHGKIPDISRYFPMQVNVNKLMVQIQNETALFEQLCMSSSHKNQLMYSRSYLFTLFPENCTFLHTNKQQDISTLKSKTVSELWNNFLSNNIASSIKTTRIWLYANGERERGRDQCHFLFLSIHSTIYSTAQNWVWFPHGFPSSKTQSRAVVL